MLSLRESYNVLHRQPSTFTGKKNLIERLNSRPSMLARRFYSQKVREIISRSLLTSRSLLRYSCGNTFWTVFTCDLILFFVSERGRGLTRAKSSGSDADGLLLYLGLLGLCQAAGLSASPDTPLQPRISCCFIPPGL